MEPKLWSLLKRYTTQQMTNTHSPPQQHMRQCAYNVEERQHNTQHHVVLIGSKTTTTWKVSRLRLVLLLGCSFGPGFGLTHNCLLLLLFCCRSLRRGGSGRSRLGC